MKFAVVVLACLVAVTHAQIRASAFSGFNNINSGRQPFRSQPPRPQPYKPAPAVTFTPEPVRAPTPFRNQAYAKVSYAGDARSANVLKYGNEINDDGAFQYFFETDNGIAAQAQGTPRNFGGNPPVVPDVVQGSFSWTSPEGVPIAITYIADENGYQPQGDAIPTPPPVPPQIARALEYIARNAPRQ